MLSFQKNHEKDMDVFIAKPGFVLKDVIRRAIYPKTAGIGIDELAAALIGVGISGHETPTLENIDLIAKGRSLLV